MLERTAAGGHYSNANRSRCHRHGSAGIRGLLSCGIHPSMAAFVVVAESAFSVVAENDGAFSLPDVPPGNYKVTLWNLDPSRRSERVVVIAIDMVGRQE